MTADQQQQPAEPGAGMDARRWTVGTYGNIGYEIVADHHPTLPSVALVNRVGIKRLEWLKAQPLHDKDGRPWPGRAEEIAHLEASGDEARANAYLMAAAPLLRDALVDWLSVHTEGMRSREAAERVYASGRIQRAVAAAEAALQSALPPSADAVEPGQ